MDGWGAPWKRQVEQALRFKNAAADNAQSVDLLVTVAEESDYRVNKAWVVWKLYLACPGWGWWTDQWWTD